MSVGDRVPVSTVVTLNGKFSDIIDENGNFSMLVLFSFFLANFIDRDNVPIGTYQCEVLSTLFRFTVVSIL